MMNLTPEQLQLLYCLLGALTLGFLFGYLLSRANAKNRYESEIEDLYSIIDAKDKEIESSSTRYGQLKQHMAIQANELKDLKQTIVDIDTTASQHKKENEQLNKEKHRLKNLLEEKEHHIFELKNNISKTESELLGVQNLIDQHKKTNIEYNNKIDEIQKQYQEKEREYIDKLAKNEQFLQDINMKNLNLEKRIEELSKNIVERDNIINEYKKRTALKEVAEKENRELKTKLEELENINKQLSEQKSKVVVKTDDKELEQLKKDLNRIERAYQQSQKDIELKEINIVNSKRVAEKAKKELADKELQIENLKKDILDLKNRLESEESKKSEKYESLQNEVLNLKSEILRKDRKLSSLEEKLSHSNSHQPLDEQSSKFLAEKKKKGFMGFMKKTFGSDD